MSQSFHSASFPSIGSLKNQSLDQSPNNTNRTIKSPSPHAPSVNSTIHTDVTSQTANSQSFNTSNYQQVRSPANQSSQSNQTNNGLPPRRRATGPLDRNAINQNQSVNQSSSQSRPSSRPSSRRPSLQSDNQSITSVDQLINEPASSTPRHSLTMSLPVNPSKLSLDQSMDDFDSDFVVVQSNGPSAAINKPSINQSIKQLLPRSNSLSHGHTQSPRNSQSPRNQSSKWSFGSLMDSISTVSVKNSAVGTWIGRAADTINQSITQSFAQSTPASNEESDEEDYMSTINDHQSINQTNLINDIILMTEGQYDVQKVDFSIEQKKNYRFLDLNPRVQKARENWFLFYESSIEKQFFAWHRGVDFRELSRNELISLCRIGVPAMMRPMVWAHARGLHNLLEANPGKYKQLWRRGLLINQSSKPLSESDQLINQSIKMIDKDLDRTFINHPAFHFSPMLERLRRVLIAFACEHPEIGYCQSMNFLCGFLLLLFDEESAFWLMDSTILHLLPADYFTDSMVGLHSDLDVFDRLVAEKMPELHSHLARLGVDLRPIAFPWFLSLFIKTLPMESALRFWDGLFAEGDKMLFRVALSLLSIHQSKILKITNFGRLYHYLSTMGSMMFDCDQLMTIAFEQRNMSSKRLNAMRDEQRKKLNLEMEQLALKRVSSQSVNQSSTNQSASIATVQDQSSPSLSTEQEVQQSNELSNSQSIDQSNVSADLLRSNQSIDRSVSEPDTPMVTLIASSSMLSSESISPSSQSLNQSVNQSTGHSINKSISRPRPTNTEWSEDDEDSLPHAIMFSSINQSINRPTHRSSNPIASSLAQTYDETYIT